MSPAFSTKQSRHATVAEPWALLLASSRNRRRIFSSPFLHFGAAAGEKFDRDVASELPKGNDERPFTIGHSDLAFTQLPARDAIATGDIQRSGRAPNCSYFTNWVNKEDTSSWNADVQIEGDYQAQVYYTCSEDDLGTVLELSCGESATTKEVSVANDPPLVGEIGSLSPQK